MARKPATKAGREHWPTGGGRFARLIRREGILDIEDQAAEAEREALRAWLAKGDGTMTRGAVEAFLSERAS